MDGLNACDEYGESRCNEYWSSLVDDGVVLVVVVVVLVVEEEPVVPVNC